MTDAIKQINAALSYVVDLARKSHQAGDSAAIRARAAKDRRTERKMQSVNKAHRATGTACEATLWLSGLVSKRMQGSTMPPEAAQARFLKFTTDASALLDDLNFEANVIAALQPVPGKPGAKR